MNVECVVNDCATYVCHVLRFTKKMCERKKALQIKSTIIITICFITAHGEITAHGIAKVR